MQKVTAVINEWTNELDHKGNYVSFTIDCSAGNSKWQIKHRFSDFENLNTYLKPNYGNLPSMPRKTFFPLKNRDDIDKRSQDLDFFVKGIIQRTDMFASSPFNEFFQIEKN